MNRIVRFIWAAFKGPGLSLALVCALGSLALGASGCFTSSNSHNSYNSYWYCWDNPAEGGPHHLGHPVSGDHICSDEELTNQGGPPR
ncbi:MAG TPA: hypothetical protein VGI52_03110 [Solirubrobacteraceae bacterium]|jgi:hypothetical protein